MNAVSVAQSHHASAAPRLAAASSSDLPSEAAKEPGSQRGCLFFVSFFFPQDKGAPFGRLNEFRFVRFVSRGVGEALGLPERESSQTVGHYSAIKDCFIFRGCVFVAAEPHMRLTRMHLVQYR